MIFSRKVLKHVLLSLVVLLYAFFSSKVFAQTKEKSKPVRVGWYQSVLFQEGMTDSEEKWGYSYKYLQVIASYNGWEYEYVYGEWPDLLRMLFNGEIDVMAGVSRTSEREEILYYPYYEMGKETYCLYQSSANKTMNISDKSSFTGQIIGAINDNLMTVYLENWIKENNVNLKIAYYNSFEERDEDFHNGFIDGAVATDNIIMSNSGYSLITEVGKEPFYLAVTKKREDLLKQLNESLYLLNQMDPYFLNNLEYSSYGMTLKKTSMTDMEKNWLKNHHTVTIGYLDNYLPYCDTDQNGNVKGLLVDVLNAILTDLGIKESLNLKYIKYSDYESLLQDLRDEKTDIIFPVGGDAWEMDNDGIDASSVVVSAGMDLVYRGNYNLEESSVFAVNKNNKLQYYFTRNNYPSSEIREFDSIMDCIDAVNTGKVDSTIINGLRIEIVNNNRKYDNLSVTQLQKSDERYFGVKNGNTPLLLLLNRGLKLIGSDFGVNASYSYINQDRQISVVDFIRSHLTAFLIFITFLIFFIVGIFYHYVLMMKRAQKKTEEANRAKTVFLSNMSHDIRTPMNAILGFADIMEKKKDNPEVVGDYIEKIKISGEYLLNIINNVLDTAKIESGKMSVDESPMDLLSEENSVLLNIKELAQKKNQEFTTSVNVEHRYIMTDVPKLQEITMNLLSNAVKYTPEGGKIQMLLEELPCDKSGFGTFRLSIKDNGIGMSKRYLEHIFEPFTRERNSTESKVIGTGLGMSIVKELVDLLGGKIEVESEPGKGSTFIVTIDSKIVVSPDDYKTQNQSEETTNDFSKDKRILLAEDNEFNAEIAIELLEDAGFSVEHAKDGVECIDMIVRNVPHYYDIILMDIQMPNIDGYGTTRIIRGMDDKEKSAIPIIAMTANAFDEDKQNALEAGMNGHIAKPVKVPELMKILAENLG